MHEVTSVTVVQVMQYATILLKAETSSPSAVSSHVVCHAFRTGQQVYINKGFKIVRSFTAGWLIQVHWVVVDFPSSHLTTPNLCSVCFAQLGSKFNNMRCIWSNVDRRSWLQLISTMEGILKEIGKVESFPYGKMVPSNMSCRVLVWLQIKLFHTLTN